MLTDVAEDPLETTQLVLERRSLAIVLRDLDGPRLLTRHGHLVVTYDRALARRVAGRLDRWRAGSCHVRPARHPVASPASRT